MELLVVMWTVFSFGPVFLGGLMLLVEGRPGFMGFGVLFEVDCLCVD